MPTPLSYSFSIPSSLTGDKAVDSLISGTYWLGSNWSVFGPTNLSYSFITETTSYFATNYSPDNEYTNAYALTSAQQNAVISALSTWSAVANINFTQTSDTLTNVGDLRFGGYLSMDSQTAAWAYFPADTPYAGDVWIGPATNNANPVKGTYDYLTFVHEIGHALGLKHPFSASSTNATLLDASLDDVRYTVMSYNDSYSYQPTTPMLLDILAIQSLYGANTLWQSGNNTYSWASDQSIFETIWDAGGNDTIDGSNQLQSVRINLNEGAFSTIGKAFVDLTTQAAVTDGLAIAFGAKIENAIGSAFDDILIGNALDNALNGGTGADIMQGGNGNDVYYVDNVGDSITELATSSSGKDTVISSMSYVLGTNLENLTLTGASSLNGTGNALNNSLVGNTGNNILDGGLGADILIGGTGNDTYIVDNTQDVVSESSTQPNEIDNVLASVSFTLSANVENLTLSGTDNINAIGNAQNNILIGNTGNNALVGGAGLDTLIGGAGNDIYSLDQVGELALLQEIANEGLDGLNITYAATAQTNVIDMGQSSLQNVENVLLTGAGAFTVIGNDLDNILLGNNANNTLQGGTGNDQLDGGAGADTLSGGIGNDTFTVDNAGDTIIELADEGRDLIRTSISYTLSANAEDGQLLGTAAIDLYGNSLDNVLSGNSSDNTLNGGLGADTLIGGGGVDTYHVDNVGDVVVETDASLTAYDRVFSSIDYTLTANLENLLLTGITNLNGTGNGTGNRITGNDGNNILDGGLGADTLLGGLGNDTYIVDNLGDTVTEASTLASEIDTVRASVNWTLGANLENLILTGSNNLNGTGNGLGNVLTGNNGYNVLDGGLGADTLIGGLGNDTYIVDNLGDTITEASALASEIDTVRASMDWTLGANLENLVLTGNAKLNGTGNSLDNTLTGNDQDNTLNGGLGADTLIGGGGVDTYHVDNVGDVVVETDASLTAYDRVFSSIDYTLTANLENLLLTGITNLNGTGNGTGNRITGNDGNNILDGGLGADTLLGGLGNDTYIVDNLGDTVTEASTLASEIDTVRASVNWTLGANLENLILTGSNNLNGTGNGLGNVLTGNNGNNVLDGGLGADTLIGGLGNDTYIVDNLGDTITEASALASEIDTVRASMDWTLGANLENLILTGNAKLNGTGNSLDNTLTGNDQDNTLNGGLGADTLIGGGGVDTYHVDNVGDVVVETDASLTAYDRVFSSIDYTLTANVENLLLTGITNLNGTGNGTGNRITGNDGNNILDGGLGADTLLGGLGNDTYIVDNLGDTVTEASTLASEIDTVRASVNWTLGANLENLVLTGNAKLNGTGNSLDNTLTGNDQDNTLNGGLGADTLIGGGGVDTYHVDNVGDVVVETDASLTAYDRVFSSIDYTLTANVENLLLTGITNLNGTGNGTGNRITGNDGNNILDGGLGADTLLGGLGNDTYIVDNLGDTVTEASTLASEIDTVRASVNWTLGANLENLILTGSNNLNGTGNGLGNVLTGNNGNNVLDGGLGADTLIGGLGNDTYIVDNLGDTITEASALASEIDTVRASMDWTLGANLENLILTGNAKLNGTGNSLDNTLTGNDQDNTLNGGLGADTLIGGGGVDTYHVDNVGDVVVETDASLTAYDRVFSSIDYTLTANVENLLLTGIANLNGTGNGTGNRITGNDGNNILDGGLGADTLLGGLGNDTYIVDNLGDTVTEASTLASEIDTVRASVNWTLGANLENLVLTGNANLNSTGNALNNVLTGNDGNNLINGGVGNDTLIGGLGIDTLTGGTGGDVFVFNAWNETGTGSSRDIITDFNSLQGDKIDLTKFDANLLQGGFNGFSFIGANDFTGAGQVRFIDNVLSGNVSGNAGADFEIQLVGVNTFSASDLVA